MRDGLDAAMPGVAMSRMYGDTGTGTQGDALADLTVDRLIRSRRRTVSLVIDETAELVVRAPMRMPMRDIERVVREKEAWIRKNRAMMRHRHDNRPLRRYADGEAFLWLGRELRLAVSDRERRVRREDGVLWMPDVEPELRPALVARWYREEARRLLAERVRLWSALMGLIADRLTITTANRRWGSCSGRANLSFTARLVMAPLDVVDYVVVHELAHIEHKNHGDAFWERVASQMPDYCLHRRWLAEQAHRMVM